MIRLHAKHYFRHNYEVGQSKLLWAQQTDTFPGPKHRERGMGYVVNGMRRDLGRDI